MTSRRLALSIKQPFAELIMLGKKRVEYRSRPTHVRGRVYIYASKGRFSQREEDEWADEYGLDVDSLPRGVLIGSVELFNCAGGAWHLRNPKRLARALEPHQRPQPTWFRPFG
jgi:hypothetical protein